MKNLLIILSLSCFLYSCEKENSDLLIGKWKLAEGYNIMAGGKYTIPPEEQRIEEYTKHGRRILYDYVGIEIARSNYKATETSVTVSGSNEDGKEWNFSFDYIIKSDTLTIRHDGGFEFYNDILIRIE